MKFFCKILTISAVMSIALGGYVTKAPVKMSKENTKHLRMMEKRELNTISSLTTSERTPIYYPQSNQRDENFSSFTLVDSSMNGYGLIVAPTRPLDVTDDGWLMVYRQFVEYPGGYSGQLGSAYSADGENWTTYQNINAGGPGGTGSPMARYPSAVMSNSKPYAFWNEYTGTGNPSYGGRLYYTWDQFGFGGGSWAYPVEVDPGWGDEKDLWVVSPAYSVDANGNEYFNVASADWTRGDAYLFTSEFVDPSGQIVFGFEKTMINEAEWMETEAGSYTSSPVLAMNDNGIGYYAVTSYWDGADEGLSPYDNYHTLFFMMTEDHGNTWSTTGNYDGVPYYTIPDNVLDQVMANYFGTGFYDECDQVEYTFDELFAAYDFDMKVDSEGNPHIVLGLLPGGPDPVSGDGYIFPSEPGSGFYYFTIDRENIANPGDACDLSTGNCTNSTGWKYSFATATHDCWSFQTAGGGSYWQTVFPSIALSEEDESTVWVVSTLLVPGEGEDPTPEEECDYNTVYNYASEDVIVNKTSNGGESWLGEYNISSTPADPDTELDDWAENSAHAGYGATNDRVNVIYQMPKWDWNTTGDPEGPDHTCRLYTGFVEYTSEVLDYTLGDANCDSQVTVQDIIALVQFILGSSDIDCGDGDGMLAADFNGDGFVNITDILSIVNYILTETKSEPATWVQIINQDNGLNFEADGEVGAFDITLTHGENFEIHLTNDALVALHETSGNETRLIVILPGSENLFNAIGNYEVKEIEALTKDGNIDIIQPNQLNISEAYPNPFNPVTTMELSLHVDSHVNISVFNIAGQLVDEIQNGIMDAGYHQVSWHAGDIASGMYIVKANDGVNVVSQKVMLLK